MRISELMAELGRQLRTHGDIQVRGTWEGVATDINSIYFGTADNMDGPALLIDVDDGSYREQFEGRTTSQLLD